MWAELLTPEQADAEDLSRPGGVWRSKRRVFGCLYGSIVLAPLTWLVSYAIWLGYGCMPFMPFVSDLGCGPSMPVFMTGMTVSGLLVLPLCFDYARATKTCIDTSEPLQGWLHTAVPWCGALISISICGVALNPWDRRLILHGIFANGVFGAGFMFCLLTASLNYLRGASYRRGFAIVTLIALCGIGTAVFGTLALQDLTKQNIIHAVEDGEVKQTILTSMKLIRENFLDFCTGQLGSLHRDMNTNICGLLEHIILGSLVALAWAQIHYDLHTWPVPPCRCRSREPPWRRTNPEQQ